MKEIETGRKSESCTLACCVSGCKSLLSFIHKSSARVYRTDDIPWHTRAQTHSCYHAEGVETRLRNRTRSVFSCLSSRVVKTFQFFDSNVWIEARNFRHCENWMAADSYLLRLQHSPNSSAMVECASLAFITLHKLLYIHGIELVKMYIPEKLLSHNFCHTQNLSFNIFRGLASPANPVQSSIFIAVANDTLVWVFVVYQ